MKDDAITPPKKKGKTKRKKNICVLYYRYLSQTIITIFGLRRVSFNVDHRKIYHKELFSLSCMIRLLFSRKQSDGKHEDLISR